jgi:hypothetical protein
MMYDTIYYISCDMICVIHKYPPPKVSLFDVVVGLAWSEDPESYAGGSTATGRGSHAGQVKGDDPEKRIPWSSRLGVGRGADNPTL